VNVGTAKQVTRVENHHGFSVLVIDDERDTAATLKRGLESKGPFTVSAFTEPLDALKSIEHDSYHILLIDVLMPKMNGLEFCQKALESAQDALVVFITASENYIDEYRRSYPKLNGHTFIIKPVSIARLSKFLLSELGVLLEKNSD
jgi:CheY-like chemotaxis protein